MSKSRSTTRREFLATSGAAVAATVTTTALGENIIAKNIETPAVATDKKTDGQTMMGKGDYRYEVIHDWPQLPGKYTWQTTHNVTVDSAENLYVIHEGHANQTHHPSIFVFDKSGKFVRAFGQQFQGGGHGIEVRKEGKEEFLYVCAYQQVKAFAKMSLAGDVVWLKHAPVESGVYAQGEDTNPKKLWGRNRFLPTNFAFLDDGGFLLADGYGSFYIHRYDKDAKWVSCFGGPGKGEGKFATPHGIWIDRRGEGDPRIVICDRAHHTVQYLTMQGKHIKTQTGFGLPANIDTWKNLMLVPELHARLTILNEKDEVVARLGDDVKRITSTPGIRNDRKKWRDGRFVHPHDACFGPTGDIFVAEWVATGRITKLKRLA